MASEPQHFAVESAHLPADTGQMPHSKTDSAKPPTHSAAPAQSEHMAPLHKDIPEPVRATDHALTILDVEKFGTDGFLKTRRRLVQAIGEGKTGLSLSAENINALLDLAEFLLSHGFLRESRSILASLEPASLTPEQMKHQQIISIAVSILNPVKKTLPEKEIQILEAQNEWPRQPLFQALYYNKTGNLKKAKPFLKRAARELGTLSASIQELTLPQMLEAAIKTKNWGAAKEFALLITKNSYLKDSSSYQYLLGKTAEAGEDYLVAFENYVKASEGEDQWAQRARLALVDLGVKTKTLDTEDVLELLTQSRFLWRGDALALKTLDRLVDAELAVNDIPAALEVLGEIIYINLDDASTQAAKEHANLLLKEYYEKGAEGKIEVTEFILGHQRIASDYRFQAGFGKFSELFADRMYRIGASSEAAREYDTTYNYLSVAQDLGLFEVEAERLDKLKLKQAKALLRGGQYEEALPILAFGPHSTSQELIDEFTFLKAELFNHTGDLSEVIKEKAFKPSSKYLSIKAKAYFAMEDWKNALDTYNLLWAQDDGSFSLTEAVNMLLAAYYEKNVDLALKLVKTFPDLTDAPQWQEIATGLFSRKEMDDVLRKSTISGNLSDAARILDVMDIINTSSENPVAN
jgi:hypothetical protein